MSFRHNFSVALSLALLISSFTTLAEIESASDERVSSRDYQEHRQRMLEKYDLRSFNALSICETTSLQVDGLAITPDETSPAIFSIGRREEGLTWAASIYCVGCAPDVFDTMVFNERGPRQRTPFRANPDWIWIDRMNVDRMNEGTRTTVDFNVKTGKLSLSMRKGGCWIPLILSGDAIGCLMPKWSPWIEARFKCTKLGLPFREW